MHRIPRFWEGFSLPPSFAGKNAMKHPAHGQNQGALARVDSKPVGRRRLDDIAPIRAMDAVVALYSEGEHELSEAIIASLSRAVFEGRHGRPAGPAQRALARISYRVLKWTTTRRKCDGEGYEGGAFRNPILERSGHPYARALLDSTSRETESLVDGGDPMNGPYMMVCPEILKVSNVWDRLFLHSVQSRDVQLRFIFETRATYDAARSRLKTGGVVRLKAVAAGTGLSMILAYDRLIKEGHNPARITVRITDRDKASIAKAERLLAKLASTRNRAGGAETEGGISAGTEDLFEEEPRADTTWEAKYHVVTAVGILDYLQGFTCDTTERSLGLPHLEEPVKAEYLAAKLGHMTAGAGDLIVNTYLPHASTRILELFGRKFDYRNEDNLTALLATADFATPRLVGSGNMYGVLVYEKNPAQRDRRAADAREKKRF
jgi:hypothetical protein